MKVRFEDFVAIKNWYYEEVEKVQKGLGPNTRIEVIPVSLKDDENKFNEIYKVWLNEGKGNN